MRLQWIRMIKEKPIKSAAIICVIVFTSTFVLMAVMGHSLFWEPSCKGWHKGMTKNEKILLGLKRANSSTAKSLEYIDPVSGKKIYSVGRHIPYADYNDIIKENPKCCAVYERFSASTEKPKEELPANDEGVVVMRYPVKYLDKSGTEQTAMSLTYDDLNVCKER